MASLTRRVIMDSVIKLLDERPLNRISVKDIVEDCGINRNTFYYHFAGLPELVEAIMKDEVDGVMRSYHGVLSLEECIEAVMRHCAEHRRAILHIYNSENRDIYERYLLETCGYVAQAFVDNLAGDMAILPDDRVVITQSYKCELFGHIVDWLDKGMRYDLKQRFLRLCQLRMGMTEEMFRRSLEAAGHGQPGTP